MLTCDGCGNDDGGSGCTDVVYDTVSPDISEPEGGVVTVHIKRLVGDIEDDFLILFICSRARGFMRSRTVSSLFCGSMGLPDDRQ